MTLVSRQEWIGKFRWKVSRVVEFQYLYQDEYKYGILWHEASDRKKTGKFNKRPENYNLPRHRIRLSFQGLGTRLKVLNIFDVSITE